MNERIPQRIDFRRYTDQGVTLDGSISLEESGTSMPRLNDAVLENTGDIKYHLEFDTDILGNRFMTGQVLAQVVLQCQRCMDNYTLDLNCDLSIAFVQSELAQKQAEESNYDIFWLAKKELIDPRTLLEDELLLALPQIPMHEESEIGKACDVRVTFLEQDDLMADDDSNSHSIEKEQNDTDNPFAILKQLKK
ncbi:YceD family protein [sulfur-oxidizing endosymbiont of Gigantopelta aegis]|uniref:YceD family protein n=1 Tax=sulfur-oxidizing endosymbiont of Gigantopelta aegis TaxID=2794934 RepID=UPI0018DDE479|nr:YceD family protein [sulfur-oxidizing endosymbiont of Gigantopelta aegis]